MPGTSYFDAQRLFSYSARFEPVSRKDGCPNLTAARFFVPIMGSRLFVLQGYVSSIAARREIRALGNNPGANVGSIETGNLKEYLVGDFTTSDTIGDVQDIGPQLVADPSKRSLSFYLLVTYLNEEVDLAERRKPVHRSEAEIVLMTDSENFCHDVMDIMESEPSKLIAKAPTRRLGVELYSDGRYKVAVDDGPLIGKEIVTMPSHSGRMPLTN